MKRSTSSSSLLSLNRLRTQIGIISSQVHALVLQQLRYVFARRTKHGPVSKWSMFKIDGFRNSFNTAFLHSRMQKLVGVFISCILISSLHAQSSFPSGSWRAELIREDG